MNLQTSVTYACLVVQYCIEFGIANYLQSVDLHLVLVSGDTVFWECVGYPKIIGSGDYFTISNSSVLLSFGYDLDVPVESSSAVDIIPPTSIQDALPVATSTGMPPPAPPICGDVSGVACV